MSNLQRGFIAPLLLALIAVLLFGGGAYVYVQKSTPSIIVLSPKGGEVYAFGSDIPFTWKRNVTKDMIEPIAYLDSINGGYVNTIGNLVLDVSGASLPNINTLAVQTGVITTSKSPMPLTGGKFKVVICEYPKNTNNRTYPAAPPLCASSEDFTITPFDTNSEPAPTASVTANPTSITAGQATTLTTSSTNARGCIGTGTDGSKFYGTGAVIATTTTTYTFTCYESPDKIGRSTSASVTVKVSPAPTSTSSPYVNTARIMSGIDTNYMEVTGSGFTTSSKVHIKGNGFDGFLSPNNYALSNGSNGVRIDVTLPSNFDITKKYDVYVSNGNTSSNTVSTTVPFRG